jgi:DNA-binding XRE family transcriptional regulator
VTPARDRREQLRVPKDQLAARHGLHAYDVSRLENGSVAPSVATLARIAFLLGTDARELFNVRACRCGCGTLVSTQRTYAKGHHDKSHAAARAKRERRRRLGIPEEKVCEGCGGGYTRRRGESTKKWLKRRWCTAVCWRSSPLARTAPHLRKW